MFAKAFAKMIEKAVMAPPDSPRRIFLTNIAVGDERTCPTCWAKHGTRVAMPGKYTPKGVAKVVSDLRQEAPGPKGKGAKIRQSTIMPKGIAPFHTHCRCTVEFETALF
jgi:hypothetical protein